MYGKAACIAAICIEMGGRRHNRIDLFSVLPSPGDLVGGGVSHTRPSFRKSFFLSLTNLLIVEKVMGRTSDHLFHRISQHLAEILIDIGVYTVLVYGPQSNLHRLNHSAKTFFALLQVTIYQQTGQAVGQSMADLLQNLLFLWRPSPHVRTLMQSEQPGLTNLGVDSHRQLRLYSETLRLLLRQRILKPRAVLHRGVGV